MTTRDPGMQDDSATTRSTVTLPSPQDAAPPARRRLLSGLLARLARGLRSRLGWREAGCAWLAAVAWAAIDEIHQSFFPVRGASGADVALDALGALAGIFAYCRWLTRS